MWTHIKRSPLAAEYVRRNQEIATHIVQFSILAGILGVAAACAPSSSEQDVADITRASHEWVAAFEANDLARTMTFITQDAVLIPPNQPAVTGADAIEAWTQAMFDVATFQEAATTVDDVLVAYDWAVSHGVWRMTMSVGDAIVGYTSRYMLIWEQQADGSWKVAHDIWNSALPARSDRLTQTAHLRMTRPTHLYGRPAICGLDESSSHLHIAHRFLL